MGKCYDTNPLMSHLENVSVCLSDKTLVMSMAAWFRTVNTLAKSIRSDLVITTPMALATRIVQEVGLYVAAVFCIMWLSQELGFLNEITN